MNDAKPPIIKKSPAVLFCVLMVAILSVLFWRCFLSDYVYFSNDGPLGMQAAAFQKAPQGFFGQWFDLWSIGWSAGASVIDADTILRWILHPVGYAKFYVPISLFILGAGAYFFFRRSGLRPMAAILGGLAACLTTNYFTDAAWGAAPAVLAFGMDFFALGALAKKDERLPFWIAPSLAGLAVGFNVMEAADIGGLFSVLVAVYVIYRSLVNENDELTPSKRIVGLFCINFSVLALFAIGIMKHFSPIVLVALLIGGAILNWFLLSKQMVPNRLGLGTVYAWFVGAFAVLMAAYAMVGFLTTSVTGINGTQQDMQTKAMKWDFATQWSLPKRETLSLIVPGLFGDRVDYGDERAYWGGMGRDASWDRFYHEALRPGDTVDVAMPGDGQVARFSINNNGDLALPSMAPIKAAGMTRGDLQNSLSTTPLKGASIEYAQGFMRHTGRGFYFGLLVVILGLWAAFQSFRKNDSVFSLFDRKMIWFWSVVGLLSLLVAHGKFSPFAGIYYWIYTHVWGLSTVRSPEKFLHVTNMSMLILFGYGVHGLDRRYLSGALSNVPFGARLRNWWGKAPAFDKRWVVGSAVAIVLAFVGWITYAALRPAVDSYLTEVQFGPRLAHAITGNSVRQVAWFVAFLTMDCALLLLIFCGAFAGRRAAWAGVLLGVLLVWDLGRANMHYTNPFLADRWDYGFWNYKEKYEVGELNPICKVLADKPYEHRVKKLPFRVPDQFYLFMQLYDIEWEQQIFPYYNIQSMDIAQLPRYPTDLEAFERASAFPGTHPFTRLWELTNTRYLLGPAGYLDVMNQQLDPGQQRFRIASVFRLGGKPEVENPQTLPELTAIPVRPGDPELTDDRVPKYALFEFTGALPRVKLYSNWQSNNPADVTNFTTNDLDGNQFQVLQMVGTNDFLTLRKLMSPSFDPARSVLVDHPLPAPANSAATNQSAGDVDFVSYAPEDIKLKANATAPSVLLLNDRYDPGWKVFVDGKSAELLRCNFIMRGVFLQPGQHEVEFQYRQPIKMLCINAAAFVIGIGLLGFAIARTRKGPVLDSEPVNPNPEKPEKVKAESR